MRILLCALALVCTAVGFAGQTQNVNDLRLLDSLNRIRLRQNADGILKGYNASGTEVSASTLRLVSHRCCQWADESIPAGNLTGTVPDVCFPAVTACDQRNKSHGSECDQSLVWVCASCSAELGIGNLQHVASDAAINHASKFATQEHGAWRSGPLTFRCRLSENDPVRIKAFVNPTDCALVRVRRFVGCDKGVL
jgi:hypothetical protein